MGSTGRAFPLSRNWRHLRRETSPRRPEHPCPKQGSSNRYHSANFDFSSSIAGATTFQETSAGIEDFLATPVSTFSTEMLCSESSGNLTILAFIVSLI